MGILTACDKDKSNLKDLCETYEYAKTYTQLVQQELSSRRYSGY